jgi:hypothetical protein
MGLRVIPEQRWIVAGVVIGVLYAALASTRPFTWAANIVTAVPIVAAGLAMAWTSRSVAALHMTAERRDAVHPLRPSWDRRWVTWVVLTAVVTGWELYCLASLPRTQHPTFSSLIDILDSTRVGKSVVFGSWVALGWFLAAR